MATKTFKIGLSNTDKQNMAQDVYERLLALTFPEYDTTETYNVGDFVVYNDQLYKCIGSTSGAWDSTKWQLATLNDLLTDIESAVAFVNDKANVDGNYPTMTVGVADQLSPYDDESGDDQDEPFSFQATGTGNGSQPDFSTGSYGLMKEKQGNTVVVNQYAKELNSINWATTNGSISFSNGVGTFTANAKNGFTSGNVEIKNGHKYLITAQIELTTATNAVAIFVRDATNSISYTSFYASSKTGKQLVSGIFTSTSSNSSAQFRVIDSRDSDWDAIKISSAIFIDLTQWFNGDIPQDLLDNPSNFFRYYQGSLAYNTGELVNADGRYIKCIGRNQFDGTNDVKVVPNSTYYIYGSATLTYKDKDGNTISSESKTNETFDIPANCLSVGVSGTGDICISIYYEGESGYDQYYPYEVLTNNDTGTEVLRSAVSIKDYKTADGTIHRLVGSVDLSTLSWGSDGTIWYATLSTPAKNILSTDVPNCLATYYLKHATSGIYDSSGFINVDASNVYVNNGSTTTQPTGTLYYELAEETTEQGTPFSENLVIDDFGSMDFQGTNGVPQGNLIFYPVDYKAFIDTLYNYTEGTPSELAKNSELNAKFETYLKSLSGYDASATQVLKNVEGTLTWVTEE